MNNKETARTKAPYCLKYGPGVPCNCSKTKNKDDADQRTQNSMLLFDTLTPISVRLFNGSNVPPSRDTFGVLPKLYEGPM